MLAVKARMVSPGECCRKPIMKGVFSTTPVQLLMATLRTV